MTGPARRWRQFSVRGGLILVTLFAIFLAWRANAWHARDRAIRRIRELGGGVVKLPQPGMPSAEADTWLARFGVSREHWEQALELAGIYREHYCIYNNGRPRADEVVAECRALGKAGEVRLFLADSDITDDGLRSLAGLTVRELYLDRTRITDRGVGYIRDIEGLWFVRLPLCPVTDAAVPDLLAMCRPNGTVVRIILQNTKLTQAGAERLKAMKDCEIDAP